MASATRSLIEMKLTDQTLSQLVREGRRRGVSWRDITKGLNKETGITISHETLRLWFKEDARKAA